MADPYVQLVGAVEDHDGRKLHVGVDYDTVTLAAFRLTREQCLEFGRLFMRAYAVTAANSERMRQEATDV